MALSMSAKTFVFMEYKYEKNRLISVNPIFAYGKINYILQIRVSTLKPV